MNFYQINLAVLVAVNTCAFVYRHRARAHKLRHGVPRDEHDEAIANKFQQRFLLVYTLVVAADWLQVCKRKTSSPFNMLC